MTIAAIVAHPEGFTVWSDSELMVEGESVNLDAAKICWGLTAGVIGVGCGNWAVLRRLNRLLAECYNFDEALPYVSRTMRGEFKKSAEAAREFGVEEPGATFALGGFSKKYKQNLVAVFWRVNDFRPVFGRSWASPLPEGQWEGDDISLIARLQMAAFRREYPKAQGGSLVVVNTRPDVVEASVRRDFFGPGVTAGAEAAARNAASGGAGETGALHVPPGSRPVQTQAVA
jgi:hypothetical protein